MFSNSELPSIRFAGYDKGNCSSLEDYEDMKEVKDCTKFAHEAEITFGGGEFLDNAPKGCYWYRLYESGYGRWKTTIHFNYHLNGENNSKKSPVCIKRKNSKLIHFQYFYHSFISHMLFYFCYILYHITFLGNAWRNK